MEERVVTIDINATVGGLKIDSCGANIILGINEIPRIELIVPPTYPANGTPLKPKVFRPRISDFSSLYSDLAGKAEGLKTKGNIDIKINTESTGKKINPETISLKDWILSGVGMSSVSATSAPHMTLILQHPVCQLAKVGSIYETPKSIMSTIIGEAAAEGVSFLDIIGKVYTAARENINYFESPGNMPKIYRELLGRNEFDPSRYIEDESPTLFMCNVLPNEALPRMAAAIGRMAIPMGDGSSTWDMIVRVASEQMLSLVQTEQCNFTVEKGLVMEPIKPWRTDRILVLDEDRCIMTDIPGQDMFKLVGVMARKLSISGQRLTNWANVLPDRAPDETGMCDVLYCPVQPENADGRIMKTSAPQLLFQAFEEDALHGGSLVTASSATSKQRLNGFDGALMRYCKAIYEITYGSMNTGRAQIALGFKDSEGKWILPGNTFCLRSQGSDIYYGYVRSVVHSLSTKGGCSTTISMSHIRPTKTVSSVPDGNSSAVYD